MNKTVCSDICRQYLRLHLAGEVGPITFARLIEHFGSIERVLAASRSHLRDVERVGAKTAESIAAGLRSDAWQEEVALAERLGVRILCREDDDFPRPLLNIPDPPICLYVLGELRREDALSVAIVGSRQASMYGLEQAQRFAELLTQAGLCVISGMARGVDQSAHLAALRMGGRTIAVLGCGLTHCYPPESVELRDRIAGCGAVVSELPLAAGPQAGNFPRRNRIIAGMSLGTLVVEAGQRSGALITARVANEYNREVFALPGRVDMLQAQGTNDLIRQGYAKLVTGLPDILDELGEVGELLSSAAGPAASTGGDSGAPTASAEPGTPAAIGQLTPVQKRIYEALTADPLHMEQLAAACDMPIGPLSAALTMLQIKGLIKQLPGNQFCRRS